MMRLGAKFNLIICQKSKVADWIQHFLINYKGLQMGVVNLTVKGAIKTFLEWNYNFKVVGIINYELAWRRKELLTLRDFTLMLDESSLIQNRKAKQTKFILSMQPQNVILLSGTPTSGKYENLWTQAHLLGWGISEKLYQQQYVNYKTLDIGGGAMVKVVDKANPYKNVERLKSKLREHGAVFLKTEDCFELPDQTFVEISVPKSKAYDKFMRNSIIEIKAERPFCEYTKKDKIQNSDFEGEDVTPTLELVGDCNFSKRLYARQLCGIYSAEKLDAFKDLIESTNDRIIVFYNFTDEVRQLQKITETLGKPLGIISGFVKDLGAYEIYSNSVTFVQYQAGAMGLNLQKANKVIYYTLPERSELFEQSKKRIHRIGQAQPCFYYVLMCRNTIEGDIYEALKQRKDYTDELFKERTGKK